MAKHIVHRYDFKTIVAGVLRTASDPSLFKRYKKYLEAEWIYHNDASDERKALREIVKLMQQIAKEGNADNMSILYVEQQIPVKYIDEEKAKEISGYYRAWHQDDEIMKSVNDDGIFKSFIDYMKILQVAKVSKKFFDSYQTGRIKEAMDVMSEAIHSANQLDSADSESMDKGDIMSILEGKERSVYQTLYPFDGNPLDGIIGGFEPQTLNLFISVTNGGKCLAKGTPILMYDGTVKSVEDVTVGDLVMGDDSKPRKVLGTTSGSDKMYKVQPKKGDSYTVNSAHILTLYDAKEDKIVDMPISDFLGMSDEARFYQKSKTNRRKHERFLSVSTGVDFGNKDIAVDQIAPYALGVWLGDGTSREPWFTSVDKEVVDAMRIESKRIGDDGIKEIGNTNITYGFYNSNGCIFRKKLIENDLFMNKHIPHVYKTASRKDRLELLAGLIDSDGHKHREGNYEISTKFPVLADDICFLARSLGYTAVATPSLKKSQNSEYKEYTRISIICDGAEIPVKLPRKKSLARKTSKKYRNYSLEITDVGQGAYYGFEVDGNHRFLLGDFTITHNSMMAHHMVEACIKQKMPVFIACVEDRMKSFVYKLLANLTGIKMNRLKKKFADLTSDEMAKIDKANELIEEFVHVEFIYGKGVDLVHKIALDYDIECDLKGKPRPVVNIVDYTGHIAHKNLGDKMHEKMRNAYGTRKDFALAHNKICIDFAQVNREGNKNMNSEQPLSQTDLAGAYDLAQVCDNIISINRSAMDITEGTARLHVCKARDGMVGVTIRVNTNFACASYTMNEWGWTGNVPKWLEEEYGSKESKSAG